MSLPCLDLQVDANFHVSTAVVHMRSVWQNTASTKVDCLFSLPIKGTVSCECLKAVAVLMCFVASACSGRIGNDR